MKVYTSIRDVPGSIVGIGKTVVSVLWKLFKENLLIKEAMVGGKTIFVRKGK